MNDLTGSRNPDPGNAPEEAVVLPVLVEQLSVQKTRQAVGAVRVRIETEEKPQNVPGEERIEQAVVQRVPRDVEVAESRPPWNDGDTLVVPVYAEHVEVRRTLILREEIHIARRVLVRPVATPATVRTERAVVERLQPDGSWREIEVESTSVPAADNPSPSSERKES